jgi:hypothetical protein
MESSPITFPPPGAGYGAGGKNNFPSNSFEADRRYGFSESPSFHSPHGELETAEGELEHVSRGDILLEYTPWGGPEYSILFV